MRALVPLGGAQLPACLPTGRSLVPLARPPKEGMGEAVRRYRPARRQRGRILDLIV
ncbi:MAG: hypothetical protein JWM77_4139 [Rhodospirillales bacterium]|jgi:hypothetical protein|nr:hypothetical protein [Rhodospirillales bacterium]